MTIEIPRSLGPQYFRVASKTSVKLIEKASSPISKLKDILPSIISETAKLLKQSFCEASIKKKYAVSKKLTNIYHLSNDTTIKIEAFASQIYGWFPEIKKSYRAKKILVVEGKYQELKALFHLVKLNEFLMNNDKEVVEDLKKEPTFQNIAKVFHYINVAGKEMAIFKRIIRNDFDIKIQEYNRYNELAIVRVE